MDNPIKRTEKHERKGWPPSERPDLKPLEGWAKALKRHDKLFEYKMYDANRTVSFAARISTMLMNASHNFWIGTYCRVNYGIQYSKRRTKRY